MTVTWQRALGLIAVFFAAQWVIAVGIAVLASLVAVLTETPFERVKPGVEAARGLLAYLLAGGIVALLVRRGLADAANRALVGLKHAGWEDLAIGLASGLAIGAFYVNLAGFLADAPATQTVPGAAGSSMSVLAWFLFALVIAPPVEEFLFRGVLQGVLGPGLGQWPAIVAVTAVFTLMHVPESLGFGPALLGIASMAAAAGWFRAQSGSIGPAVAVHLGYNLALASAVGASLWL